MLGNFVNSVKMYMSNCKILRPAKGRGIFVRKIYMNVENIPPQKGLKNAMYNKK